MNGYAKAPGRATGKLTIAFGLVAVPVDVFNGVDEDANKVTRNMRVAATGAAVKFHKADAETGALVDMNEIKYVAVQEDGTEVDLTDEEMDQAMGLTNGECSLVGFFDLAHLHNYETKGVFQVRPQAVKVGKKTTHPFVKAFQLLTRGMQATGTFALLTYVMRGKLHLAGLTADGEMRDFYWANEVREARPLPTVDVTDKEAGLAQMLVEKMRGDAPPVMENTAVQAVHAYVAAKAAGEVDGVVKAEDVKPAGEMDLEALLAAALAG